MTALSIQPPYPIFTEADGSPLENGFIYIGTANLDPVASPIAVFWDVALTVPAAQPIRTLNGYPSRNGTPARLYVGSDYSIRVNDSKGVTVYSAPAATERWSNVVVTGADASEVTFTAAGVGASQRTAQEKMRDTLCVFDFMSAAQISDVLARTLLLDVTSAMQAAHTAANGRPVYYPRGAYLFSAITLAKSGDGIVGDGSGGVTGEDQTLLVSTVTGTTPAILLTTSVAHNVVLKDCTLKQNSGTVQGRGVSLQDCYWFRTDNLRIIGFTDNIYASLSIYHHHKRLLSEKSANGVNYWGAAGAWNTAWFNNVLTFDTCRFSECSVTGVAVKGCEVVFINPDYTGMSATGAIGCRVYGESNSFRAHGIKILTPYLEIVKIAFSFAFARVEITGDGFVQGGPDVPGQATSIIDASESYVLVSGVEDKDYWQFGYRLTNNSTLIMQRPLSGSIRATAGTADATSVFISDETRAGTFTVTLTGCTTTVTGTASWERRGNIVTLLLPSLSGTSNVTTCTLTGAPAAILPATEQFGMINVQNSAAEIIGSFRYFTSGTISLSAGAFGAAFTASGVKGVRASSISYLCV